MPRYYLHQKFALCCSDAPVKKNPRFLNQAPPLVSNGHSALTKNRHDTHQRLYNQTLVPVLASNRLLFRRNPEDSWWNIQQIISGE